VRSGAGTADAFPSEGRPDAGGARPSPAQFARLRAKLNQYFAPILALARTKEDGSAPLRSGFMIADMPAVQRHAQIRS